MRILAFALVTIGTTAACREPAAGPAAGVVADAATDGSSAPSAITSDAAVDAEAGDGGAPSGARGAKGAMKAYYDFEIASHDIQNADRLTFEALAADTSVPIAEAVVLCRVGIVEPAPFPKNAWDRRNGRDLAIEVLSDDKPERLVQGPLGAHTFVVRADNSFRAAAAGKRVRWALRDRDQDNAGSYSSSIVVGEIDIPGDAKLPFKQTTKTVSVDCRGATRDAAMRALLPAADRALDASEKKLAWGADDPRSAFLVRDAVWPAAEAIRHVDVFANSLGMREESNKREERLRLMVEGYLARAKDVFDNLAPPAVGTWVPIGAALTARVVERKCPALAKTDDPGSLNDEQKEVCGLVVDVKSVGTAKLRWDVNPNGPIYACRDAGPLRFEIFRSPTSLEPVCILGVRRGAQWQKQIVELSPTEPTRFVLSVDDVGRALRVAGKGGSGWLAVPSDGATDAGAPKGNADASTKP